MQLRNEQMSIFDHLEEKFFNPFGCRNRRLYYECANQLIDLSKQIPVLYETEAKNCLIIYLRNIKYAIDEEDIGVEISNQRTEPENASAILQYFRTCGWLTPKEVGRNGDNIAAVSAHCRKLIEALNKLFDGETSGAITNHIFSMYEILKASLEKDSVRAQRPYSTILVPLVDHECDLKNELLLLKDSIRAIMHSVMKMEDANSFGQFLMKDQMLERFFNDYFFIKKSGTIPTYISGMERMLARLRRTSIYDRMITEYIQIREIDTESAKEVIALQFSELESFIRYGYDEEMNLVDRKINSYYNLYSTRMMMVISNNTNLQNVLNQVLLTLRDADDEEREKLLEKAADCSLLRSYGYVGRKSFERRKKRNPHTENAALLTEEISDEEKKRLTEELLTDYPDRYSLDYAKAYYDTLLKDRSEITTPSMPVRDRGDAMMVAAGIIYSESEGFPYQVEFGDGVVETAVATVSNIRIRKKG